jgi:hypothetical protein
MKCVLAMRAAGVTVTENEQEAVRLRLSVAVH